MRATVLYGAGDVRVEHVPDARIIEPTDALLAVTRACICGSDLWPYTQMEHSETGQRMGHEFIGVVEGDELVAHTLAGFAVRSAEHTSELQSRPHLVCRLL